MRADARCAPFGPGLIDGGPDSEHGCRGRINGTVACSGLETPQNARSHATTDGSSPFMQPFQLWNWLPNLCE